MAEYISDFVMEEGSQSSPLHDYSPQPSTPPPYPGAMIAKHHAHNHPNPSTPPPTDDKDLDHSNHDLCDYCGDGGDLLCCDRCPASFHLLCADPPLSAIPDGDWFCRQCTTILFPPAAHLLPKNPIAAALIRQLRTTNPHVYNLPKEIFEMAKKGKNFSEGGEGRQMGTGSTAVDVFGNRVLQGVCNVCTVEGKQIELIACSVCKTIYHTYCLDPVLTSKPSGYWICPNHEADAILPPGVSRMLKITPADPRKREIVHLLPGDTMRLNFEPNAYDEFSDDSDDSYDYSDSDDSSSDRSDASGPPGHRRIANPPTTTTTTTSARPFFQSMVRALQEASRLREIKNNQEKKPSFDSYTYLDDFYDDEAFEEIDLFTPPEDQTRLLLNLGKPQRLRYNIYDPAIKNQNKNLEDLLIQQRMYTNAAMPLDSPFSTLSPSTPSSTPNGINTTIPSTIPSPSTTSSTTPSSTTTTTPSATTTNTMNNTEKDTDKMDTSSDSATPSTSDAQSTTTATTTTTSTSDTSTNPNNNNNTTNNNNTINPSDAIFAHGMGSPLALSQLSPLFTQFLAWQRLMQINQQIQQQTLPPQEQAQLQQARQQQQQNQMQHLQQQQLQLRQYYDTFQDEQRTYSRSLYRPPPPPPRRWTLAPDTMDVDVGGRYEVPYPPRNPRIPLRSKSPRSKPFAKSSWMRERMAPPPISPPAPPAPSHPTTTPSRHAYDSRNHTPATHTPIAQPKIKVANFTSSYGHPTRTTPTGQSTVYSSSNRSNPNTPNGALPFASPIGISPIFGDFHADTSKSSDQPEASPFVAGVKNRPGRKRKAVSPSEAPTSPKKTIARRVRRPSTNDEGEDDEKDREEEEGEGGVGEEGEKKAALKVKKPKKANDSIKLRGKGGRFVHKDPAMAALALSKSTKKGGKKDKGLDDSDSKASEESSNATHATGEADASKLDSSIENKEEKAQEVRLASIRRETDIKRLQTNGSENNETELENDKDKEREAKSGNEASVQRTEPIEATRAQETEQVRETMSRGNSETTTLQDVQSPTSTSMELDSVASPDPTTKTGGPAEVGPKRSTRVREKGEKVKLREAEEAALAKEKEDEKKAKQKRKEAKEAKAKELEASGMVVDKKRKEKKRKKDDEQQSEGEAKKKTEKKKAEGDAGEKAVKKENGYDPTPIELPSEPKKAKENEKKLLVPKSVPATSASPGVIPLTGPMLELLSEENTTYPYPLASLRAQVIPDPENDPHPIPADIPAFERFQVTKRITSIGRNRQNKRDGESTPVDIDLAIFGQYARAASHLHAYIVYSPPTHASTKKHGLPEFSLWLMGRNFTKINGVLHREGIIPLPLPSVFKISKLKLEFERPHN